MTHHANTAESSRRSGGGGRPGFGREDEIGTARRTGSSGSSGGRSKIEIGPNGERRLVGFGDRGGGGGGGGFGDSAPGRDRSAGFGRDRGTDINSTHLSSLASTNAVTTVPTLPYRVAYVALPDASC